MSISSRRAKAAATATVLGLGALGGVAMATNPGVPAQVAQAGGGNAAPVVTGASSTAATTSQPVALREGAATRPPIVTRASGGGAVRGVELDD